jgi:hypothetical protein
MDKRVKTALMVFLLISLPFAMSWAQKQSSADADSVAIKQAVASWSDAFNRHDPHAVAMLFPRTGTSQTRRDSTATAGRKLKTVLPRP